MKDLYKSIAVIFDILQEILRICYKINFYPALAGSKTFTLKLNESKEVSWGIGLLVKAQLVKTNNQWRMKPPTD